MEKNYRDQWNKEEVAWGPEILLIPYSVLYDEYPRAGDSSEGKCLNTKHLLFPRHCELAVLTSVHVIFTSAPEQRGGREVTEMFSF